MGVGLFSGCRQPAAGSKPANFQIATFAADVTVPIGHPLLGGLRPPAKEIKDPLSARGFVLLGAAKPLVVVAVEWCELRNDSYDRWREVLAQTAGTEKNRVLVTATHVHDAPVTDLAAERLLEAAGVDARVCDLEFHEEAVQRVAAALRAALRHPRRVTHFGVGEAKVEKVASNRRYLRPDGRMSFARSSMKSDADAKHAPEGTIDPMLKTLSFWDGDQPLVALHVYAVHPMSFYGTGSVSDDFVGLARRRRQADDPGIFQIYASGCSGNITAGKYNDGTPTNRPVLAGRIYDGMVAAWHNTRRLPLTRVDFRCVPLELQPRNDTGFTVPELWQTLTNESKPSEKCLAALGLSWRQRVASGEKLDLPVIDFGVAKLALLPAESFVEFQLFAQQLCPDSFVLTMGYGECAPGYIATDVAFAEKDDNLDGWCWTTPGGEQRLRDALRAALRPNAPQQ